MIHVAYRLWGGDGFFAKMLGTSMLSMFENTKEKITVHIMHNERLTPDNRSKFCYIASQYNQQITFHNVEEIAGPTLRKFEEAHPLLSGINAAFYPLIVHEVFPDFDKIILLGADTVINLDIADLWSYTYDLDKSEYGFAAVPEALNKTIRAWLPLVKDNLVEYDDYFNCDILLIKVKFFRDNFKDILKASKFVYENGYLYAEQDIINYLFSKKYFKLPWKFNTMLISLRLFTPKPHNLEDRIYHFSGSQRPSLDTDDIFNRLYFDYFLKTPWINADMLGNIDKSIRKNIDDYRDYILTFINSLSKRQRAFFIDDEHLEIVKQIFEIKDYELVISSSEGIEEFLKKITALKEEKIFFLFVNSYIRMSNYLSSNNFVESRDYVNGFIFLSEKYSNNFKFNTTEIFKEI